MLAFLWRATKGYRLAPWRSPYLRWRVETYWGLHADRISDSGMRDFMWSHKAELFRFLRWAARMSSSRRAA